MSRFFREAKQLIGVLGRLLTLAIRINSISFFVLLCACLLSSFIPLATAYCFGQILNDVVSKATDSIFLLFLGLYAICNIIDIVAKEVFDSLTWSIYRLEFAAYFTNLVVKKIAELDLETLETPAYADLKAQVTDSYDWRPSAIVSEMFELFKSFCVTLFAGSTIIFLFPGQALLLILSILPSVLVDFTFKRGAGNLWELETPTRRKYGAYRAISERQFKEVRLLGLADHFRMRLMEIYREVQHKERAIQVKRSFWFVVSALPIIITTVFVILYLSQQAVSGVLSLGLLTFFIASLLQFKGECGNTLYTAVKITTNLKYLISTFEFLDLPARIVSPPGAIQEITTPPEIIFKGVSFAYPGTSRPVFTDLNLHIQPGQKVALVGENGVGKSTLVKLLLRFYDPDAGAVLINGVDLRLLDLSAWYDRCAVLLQDFSNFALPTIEENIGFGNLARYQQEKAQSGDGMQVLPHIQEAAQHAMAGSFILDHPKGYRAPLGREFEGRECSGGEHQRLALARTFYRNSGMIILDEPTSAVDAKAEAEIFGAIKEHLADKTVLFVSHRFSTVRIADRIIVIENGRLIEDGTHEELLILGGLYSKMFSLQAEGYK